MNYPQQPEQPPQGWPPQPSAAPYGYPPQQPEPRNAFGITALVLAIVGAVFALVPFTGFIAVILGLLALLFALLNRGRLKRRTATNKGITIAGAIVGLLATVGGVIGMVIVFSAVDELDDDLACIDEAKNAKQLDRC